MRVRELARLDPADDRGAGDGTRDPTDAVSAVPCTSSIGLVGLYGSGTASSARGVAEVVDAGGASEVVGATVDVGTLSGSTCIGWNEVDMSSFAPIRRCNSFQNLEVNFESLSDTMDSGSP